MVKEPTLINYKAYPFLYSIVSNQATGIAVPKTGGQSDFVNYITVAAGQTMIVPVKFQQDKFHLITYYRFLALGQYSPGLWSAFQNAGAAPALPEQPWVAYGQTDPGVIPYLNYINTQISIDSRDATFIQDVAKPAAMQTMSGGMGMVRKPFFVPKNSAVTIKLTNTFSASIRVMGYIYTYKSTV